MNRPNTPEGFWAKVDKSGECWLWTGTTVGRAGAHYGQAKWHGTQIYAHRLAYELLVGTIPDGLQIDHLCRVHLCVNPAHMEPVTNRENTIRGNDARGRAMHCQRGHLWTDRNSVRGVNGRRHCRTCVNAAARRRDWAKRHPQGLAA